MCLSILTKIEMSLLHICLMDDGRWQAGGCHCQFVTIILSTARITTSCSNAATINKPITTPLPQCAVPAILRHCSALFTEGSGWVHIRRMVHLERMYHMWHLKLLHVFTYVFMCSSCVDPPLLVHACIYTLMRNWYFATLCSKFMCN